MSSTALTGLGPADVRRMLDLVSETARVSENSTARILHVLRGLMDLTHSNVGVMARVRRVPGNPFELQAFVDLGWESDSIRNKVVEAAIQPGYADPILEGGSQQLAGSRTFLRRAVMDDNEWYNSAHFCDLRRAGRIDDCAYSIYPLDGTGQYVCLGLHRGLDDRTRYSERDRQIIDFVWQSLGWLHQTPLEVDVEGAVRLIPTDLLPVLRLLKSPGRLEGAARRLGMTQAEFRRKCAAVYSHFSVGNRVELLIKLTGE